MYGLGLSGIGMLRHPQTTSGLFVPNAVQFDGTNDYMTRDNGNFAMSELVCAFWARLPTTSSGGIVYQHLWGLDFELNVQTGVTIILNRNATQINWQIFIADWDPFGPDGPVANIRWQRAGLLSSSFTASAWHHYYARMRFTNNTFDLRMDGTSVGGITDFNPFALAATGWDRGPGVFAGAMDQDGKGDPSYFPAFNGDVGQFWYGHPNTGFGTAWDYTDFVNADGTPKNLGTGIIHGYTPQMYLINPAATFNQNTGSIGDFALTGSLVNVSGPTVWNT